MMHRQALLLVALVACGGSSATWSVVEEEGGTANDDGGTTDDSGVGIDAATPKDSSTTDAPSQDSSSGSNIVFGSTSYSGGSPGINANESSAHSGQTPLQGKNCFQAGGCHSESSTVYAFMGTVFDSATGTAGVKNAEVRVVSANGTPLGVAYSDDDGNFWLPGALSAGAQYVGVRTSTSSRVQTMALGGPTEKLTCNSSSCHGPGARIHVP